MLSIGVSLVFGVLSESCFIGVCAGCFIVGFVSLEVIEKISSGFVNTSLWSMGFGETLFISHGGIFSSVVCVVVLSIKNPLFILQVKE